MPFDESTSSICSTAIRAASSGRPEGGEIAREREDRADLEIERRRLGRPVSAAVPPAGAPSSSSSPPQPAATSEATTTSVTANSRSGTSMAGLLERDRGGAHLRPRPLAQRRKDARHEQLDAAPVREPVRRPELDAGGPRLVSACAWAATRSGVPANAIRSSSASGMSSPAAAASPASTSRCTRVRGRRRPRASGRARRRRGSRARPRRGRAAGGGTVLVDDGDGPDDDRDAVVRRSAHGSSARARGSPSRRP